jgi:hypothetical protein
MQLTLSKKDVAQLHVMLSTLPIPPIPVSIMLDLSGMEVGDVRTSFEMATVQIQKDAKCDDQVINTHSIIAALSFFTLWNAEKNTDEHRKKIMHAKEAVVLKLIRTIIDYSEKCTASKTSYNDKDIAEIFFNTSVEWIACNMPENADLKMVNLPDFDKITYEHPLHVAMAHYCYSQGVLYSNKTSKVNCQTHLDFESEYQDKKKECTVTREEHLEIAEMYSGFSYSKLLVLCYNRLLKDSLYGHNYNENEDIYENAKQLLDLSVTNYNKVINGQITEEEEVVGGKVLPASGLSSIPDESDTTDRDFGASVEVSSPVLTAESADTEINVVIPATILPEESTVLEVVECEPLDTKSEAELPVNPPRLSITIPVSQAECLCVEENKSTPTIDIIIEDTKSPEILDTMDTLVEKNDPGTVSENINIMQMLSYKSAAGIFVMEILNFLKNDSVYTVDNMKLNLRHLIELMSINDTMVREACQIVNIPKLVELVTKYTKNDPKLHKNNELEALVAELQDLALPKIEI